MNLFFFLSCLFERHREGKSDRQTGPAPQRERALQMFPVVGTGPKLRLWQGASSAPQISYVGVMDPMTWAVLLSLVVCTSRKLKEEIELRIYQVGCGQLGQT